MRTLRRFIGLMIVIGGLAACGLISGGTAAPTPTATSFPFVTATTRPSATPTVPTETPIPTATIFIPTATHTPRPTVTPTFTPSLTPEATWTPDLDLTATMLSIGGAVCPNLPEGVFLAVYVGDPHLSAALGCPTAPGGETPHVWPVQAIYQPFERGHMVWLSNVGWFEGKVIYVMLDDLTYTRRDDYYHPHFDPVSENLNPPEGLYEPVEALGKMWRETPGLQERIGFGTAPESRVETQMQMFQYGEMVHLPPIQVVFAFKRGERTLWSHHSVGPEPEAEE